MKRVIGSVCLFLSVVIASAEEPDQTTQVKEPALRGELLNRIKSDQDVRRSFTQFMKDNGPVAPGTPLSKNKEKMAEFEKITDRMKSIDADNTKWLKSVIERHGWLGASLVGQDGSNAAWLLVQHADADPKFQRHCLDLMAKLPPGEVSRSELAYLTDRVLLAEGKKQKYGTQCTFVDGKWKPRPLEDEANVDKLRAEVGLPPLAEYLKLIEQHNGGKK